MSNNLPSTPIHVAGAAEQVVPSRTLPPNAKENFALDDDARVWVDVNVVGLMQSVMASGEAIREEWDDIRRMSMVEFDDNQNYRGNSNIYIPAYAKARETRVSHTARGLFPTDDFVDVAALHDGADPAQADVLKAWMKYQLDCQARVRINIKPFLRQLFDYGVSVGKVWYNTALKKSGRTGKLPAFGAEPLLDYGPDLYQEGARFLTRSVYGWYAWPTTVNHIREANLVFEIIQVSKQYVQEVGKLKGWVNMDAAMSTNTDQGDTDNWQQRAMQALNHDSETAANNAYKGDLGAWVLLREAYFNMPVPKRLYTANEEDGQHVPVQALFANNQLVMLRRNPYFFQHAPYVVKRLNETPDAFNGVGMGRLGKGLQYFINDMVNQTNDNLTYSLNPVMILNPNTQSGDMLPIEPGRIWHNSDVQNGIKWMHPPTDQLQWGIQGYKGALGDMNDLLGTPPIMQGNSAGGAAKTATGAQMLQQNVKTDMQDVIEDIELEVLEPLMYMIHSLGQEYQTDALSIATSGGIVRVQPGDLAGQFNFRWLASTQAANQQMRNQQALTLLQAIAPLVPLLQQQGVQLQLVELVKKLYQGMGYRDFNNFAIQGPQAQMLMQQQQMAAMQQQQAQQGGPGGQPGAPGQASPQAPGSAVDQAAGNSGGSNEMQAGEGEGLGEVRGGANDIAALMGALNGGQH